MCSAHRDDDDVGGEVHKSKELVYRDGIHAERGGGGGGSEEFIFSYMCIICIKEITQFRITHHIHFFKTFLSIKKYQKCMGGMEKLI